MFELIPFWPHLLLSKSQCVIPDKDLFGSHRAFTFFGACLAQEVVVKTQREVIGETAAAECRELAW